MWAIKRNKRCIKNNFIIALWIESFRYFQACWWSALLMEDEEEASFWVVLMTNASLLKCRSGAEIISMFFFLFSFLMLGRVDHLALWCTHGANVSSFVSSALLFSSSPSTNCTPMWCVRTSLWLYYLFFGVHLFTSVQRKKTLSSKPDSHIVLCSCM